jgi:hypothetical protein
MPMRRRTLDGRCTACVDVLAIEQDLSLGARAGIVSCMRLRHRSSVDLPQPDGPMIAVTCPSWKAMSTSRTVRVEP